MISAIIAILKSRDSYDYIPRQGSDPWRDMYIDCGFPAAEHCYCDKCEDVKESKKKAEEISCI